MAQPTHTGTPEHQHTLHTSHTHPTHTHTVTAFARTFTHTWATGEWKAWRL